MDADGISDKSSYSRFGGLKREGISPLHVTEMWLSQQVPSETLKSKQTSKIDSQVALGPSAHLAWRLPPGFQIQPADPHSEPRGLSKVCGQSSREERQCDADPLWKPGEAATAPSWSVPPPGPTPASQPGPGKGSPRPRREGHPPAATSEAETTASRGTPPRSDRGQREGPALNSSLMSPTGQPAPSPAGYYYSLPSPQHPPPLE